MTRAAEDPWWGGDKALHLAVGIGIGSGCYGVLWAGGVDSALVRLGICAAVGQLPGLGKEIYDAGRPANRFSGKDLLWTAIGVLGGAAVVFGVEELLARAGQRGRSALGTRGWIAVGPASLTAGGRF